MTPETKRPIQKEKDELPLLEGEPTYKSVATKIEDTVEYEANHIEDLCTAKVTLFWDLERSEWLAKFSGEFLEGYERGEQVFLPTSGGPLRLNESACIKILEAYNIMEGSISMEDILKTSPEKLNQLPKHIEDVPTGTAKTSKFHVERRLLSPDDLEREAIAWGWEPAGIRVLKDLVTMGQVKVDSFRGEKHKWDTVLIRSSETVSAENNPFRIETFPFYLKRVIDRALIQGGARANISTLLYTESDDTRGPGDVGYPCGESVSNAHYRKDEVALRLTGDKPALSTSYLGEEESGWVVMDQDPRFPDIQII